jgi:hypothetical protein
LGRRHQILKPLGRMNRNRTGTQNPATKAIASQSARYIDFV